MLSTASEMEWARQIAHRLCPPWNETVHGPLARAEGWTLSTYKETRFQRPLRLEKLDAADVFTDDEQAWRHVYARAAAGSELHKRALDMIEQESLEEFADIVKYGKGESP